MYTLIGSKFMTQNTIISIFVSVRFCKKNEIRVLFLVIFEVFAFFVCFSFLS